MRPSTTTRNGMSVLFRSAFVEILVRLAGKTVPQSSTGQVPLEALPVELQLVDNRVISTCTVSIARLLLFFHYCCLLFSHLLLYVAAHVHRLHLLTKFQTTVVTFPLTLLCKSATTFREEIPLYSVCYSAPYSMRNPRKMCPLHLKMMCLCALVSNTSTDKVNMDPQQPWRKITHQTCWGELVNFRMTMMVVGLRNNLYQASILLRCSSL